MDRGRLTDLGQYILEEWTEDYRAGRLDRREFFRRVVTLAGSQAAALALLASVGERAAAAEVEDVLAQAPPTQQTGGVTVPPEDPALEASTVRFSAESTEVVAYLARPRGRPQARGLVVVHENRGLVEHVKDVARRLAKVGYVAVAPDLASHEGGTDRFADPAQVTALLGRTPVGRLVGMLVAAVEYLRGRSFVRADRLGAIGWCFGGGMVVHEIVVYPAADHAFFNDTGARYNPEAARQAWERALDWFRRYLDS